MKTNSTQKRNKSFSFILEILNFFWASVSSNLTLFWTVHFSFCNETVILKSLFWLETSKMHENESFMQAKKVSEYAFVAELLKIKVEKIDSLKVYHAFKISPCYASFSSLDLLRSCVTAGDGPVSDYKKLLTTVSMGNSSFWLQNSTENRKSFVTQSKLWYFYKIHLRVLFLIKFISIIFSCMCCYHSSKKSLI